MLVSDEEKIGYVKALDELDDLIDIRLKQLKKRCDFKEVIDELNSMKLTISKLRKKLCMEEDEIDR